MLLGSWLEPSDAVEHVEAVETAVVGRRCRIGSGCAGSTRTARLRSHGAALLAKRR
jgi:hypothetical protein